MKQRSTLLLVLCLICLSCAKEVKDQQALIQPEAIGCVLTYDKPGSYTLDQDITSDTCGIQVTASNVSIDLNGHKIQGPNNLQTQSYGIFSIDQSNVKVTNGLIDGFAYGVFLVSSNGVGNKIRGNEVTQMQVSNSSLRGIQIHGYSGKADSNKVRDSGGSLAYPDAFGFGIEMIGPDCMVSNNEVIDTYGSTSPGAYIGEGVAISFSFYSTNCAAIGNTIHNNRAVTNKSTFGFWVDVYSVVTIRNNTVSGMHYSGIVPPRTIQINNTTDIPFSDGCYDRD